MAREGLAVVGLTGEMPGRMLMGSMKPMPDSVVSTSFGGRNGSAAEGGIGIGGRLDMPGRGVPRA